MTCYGATAKPFLRVPSGSWGVRGSASAPFQEVRDAVRARLLLQLARLLFLVRQIIVPSRLVSRPVTQKVLSGTSWS